MHKFYWSPKKKFVQPVQSVQPSVSKGCNDCTGCKKVVGESSLCIRCISITCGSEAY